MSQETCDNLSLTGNRLFYGCGKLGRASTKSCGGFPQAYDVNLTSVWSSSDGSFATAANTDPAQGPLCCPP